MVYPKMILTRYFACANEIIQILLTYILAISGASFRCLNFSYKHILLFGVGLQDLKRKLINLIVAFFFRENSDFPCLHFHNGKIPGQDHFWA